MTAPSIREALEHSAEGWTNAIELGLLPPQHVMSATILRDEALAALAAPPQDVVEGIALDAETIQTLLDLLNPLHGSLDEQTYNEKLKENFDAPREYEHHVMVTWGQESDLSQAVCILEDRKSQIASGLVTVTHPDEAAIRADERERCAKIAENFDHKTTWSDDEDLSNTAYVAAGETCDAIAAAIRAGGAK